MTNEEIKKIKNTPRKLPYYEKSLERDALFFKWKTNDKSFKLPFMPEMRVTLNGSLGYDLVHKVWVEGGFNGITDETGDFTTYICHTLATENVQNYELKNHKEVIVCGNTPLYRSFEDERRFYSSYKEEIDISILCQLINSRLNKAIVTDSDNKKKQVEKAYDMVKLGYPLVLVTSLLENLETLDLTDPDDIDKMQYLSTFYQSMEKREANDAGIDLELIDKRAQVTSNEIKQYDDVTSLEFLIMYEMRLSFVEEMKENGFDIEIVKNPIFFDEPTKEDIEEGTFEAAEAEEAPEENTEENTEETEGADNENVEN